MKQVVILLTHLLVCGIAYGQLRTSANNSLVNYLTITGSQTPTNKTISGATNTISNISLTTGITGTLPIGNGGTNLSSITGQANKFIQVNAGETGYQFVAGTGGGISTLNTLTDATQTFATGTTGTNFNISSSGTTHTFNIPDASTTARGLITTGSQTLSGAKNFNQVFSVSSNFAQFIKATAFTGILTPTELTGDENNYDPGISDKSVIRTTSTVDANITGLVSYSDGSILFWHNDDASELLILQHEDANSTASNRFDLPGDIDYTIQPGKSVILKYNGTSERWEMVSNGHGLFSSTYSGIVSASGGGTTNFLRADGTWAAPPGGSGHTIKEEGSGLTNRAGLNFVGAGITATDDAGNDETDVTLDADLNTISGLTATTDNFMVVVSSAWASVTPANARTALGGTTVGQNYFTLTNPSAITFPRMNADNTVTSRTAAELKTDLSLNNVDNTSDATKNSATATLTNKRISKRTGTVASSATPTINTDNVDLFTITAQTVDITSMSTNLSGTPSEGDEVEIWITGTASRAITWGASFSASSIALPTATSGTATLRTKFVRNGSTWVIVGIA